MSKKKPKDIIEEPELKEDGLELFEMQLDKMDFEIVKKILSDHIADDILEDVELETSEDEAFLELIVETLDEGLKQASNLLEVPVKELKYKVLEKVLKEEDDEVKHFNRIEFRKKLVSGKSILKVSEDKLTVFLQIVFPKDLDGEETSEIQILDLIKKEDIEYGINHKEIERIVRKLRENYDALLNVIVAKGKPPEDGKDSELLYSEFNKIEEINYNGRTGKYLVEIIKSSFRKTIETEYFPVFYIKKGDLIASTSIPGNGTPGKDVFGEVINADRGNLLFLAGENVDMKNEGDHINYYAKISGYLEYEEGSLRVHSPIWISSDFIEAYYLELPSVSDEVRKPEKDEIHELLDEREVKVGIEVANIEKILDKKEFGRDGLKFNQVAKGVKEVKGEDSMIELFFDTDTKAGKILEDGRMDYRELDLIKTVKAKQLIAVKYPPKEGNPGKNLKGETVIPEKGDDKEFNALNNVKAVDGKDKTLYYSTIEGRVVLVGDSGISVNQVYEINENVDFSTGNIDFNGDVHIKGSVMSGFKVKAEGDITVNGMVNQTVELISNGNINVKKGVIGRKNDTKLIAKGNVIAQYIQNALVETGADLVARDYIMNCFVKAHGKVITPDLEKSGIGKGSIMGGETMAKKGVVANSIGSSYSALTRVIAGVDYEFDTKIKNFNKGLEYCDSEISKLSKFLKLGFNDMKTLKERVAKLPKDKQKPFIEAFKKLSEIAKLREEISNKKTKLGKETDELSQLAEVQVKKELFPKVIIQIGQAKISTEGTNDKVKLKESKDRKYVEILKL